MSNLRIFPTVYLDTDNLYLLSGPTVLRSAAGWYIGRVAIMYYSYFEDEERGVPTPYDRASEYFETKELAQGFLDESSTQAPDGYLNIIPTFMVVKKLWMEQNPRGETPWDKQTEALAEQEVRGES